MSSTGLFEDAWYDVAYCGHLAEIRRVDLLIEAARLSPQLRVVIAGEGRTSTRIAREASALPNVNFVGWTDRPDEVLASARVVYYGLDPAWPYAAKACPNTLYQAIRLHRRPSFPSERPQVRSVSSQPDSASESAPTRVALHS